MSTTTTDHLTGGITYHVVRLSYRTAAHLTAGDQVSLCGVRPMAAWESQGTTDTTYRPDVAGSPGHPAPTCKRCIGRIAADLAARIAAPAEPIAPEPEPIAAPADPEPSARERLAAIAATGDTVAARFARSRIAAPAVAAPTVDRKRTQNRPDASAPLPSASYVPTDLLPITALRALKTALLGRNLTTGSAVLVDDSLECSLIAQAAVIADPTLVPDHLIAPADPSRPISRGVATNRVRESLRSFVGTVYGRDAIRGIERRYQRVTVTSSYLSEPDAALIALRQQWFAPVTRHEIVRSADTRYRSAVQALRSAKDRNDRPGKDVRPASDAELNALAADVAAAHANYQRVILGMYCQLVKASHSLGHPHVRDLIGDRRRFVAKALARCESALTVKGTTLAWSDVKALAPVAAPMLGRNTSTLTEGRIRQYASVR